MADSKATVLCQSRQDNDLEETVCTKPEASNEEEIREPVLFKKIEEKNITFCIDTSGTMLDCLETVKEQLINVLLHRANTLSETKFNIIQFSSEIIQWSDRMVHCTRQTAAVASEWIKNLQPQTGRNIQDALLAALNDQDCDAVYVVTGGIPDQNPVDIIDTLIHASNNRPIHSYYLKCGTSDASATEFLQDLSMETYGSFHIIKVNQHGRIAHISPIYRGEDIIRTTQGSVFPANEKLCSMSTGLIGPPSIWMPTAVPTVVQTLNPFYPYYPPAFLASCYPQWHASYYAGMSRYRDAKTWLKQEHQTMEDLVPGAGALLIGTKVLARRNEDGLYYIGKIKSQILANTFLVEFGPCKHGKYKETQYQEINLFDIVSHADALRHSIVEGDNVLAPWEPEGERHGPGTVLSGQERRAADGGSDDEDLIVSFHNGKTATVPRDKAVWIPNALFERTAYELRLPKRVRQDFADHESYPEKTRSGYPATPSKANPPEYMRYEPRWLEHQDPLLLPSPGAFCHSPYYGSFHPGQYERQPGGGDTGGDHLDQDMVPGTELTKEELNEKVLAQLMQHKALVRAGDDHRRGTPRRSQDGKLLNKRTTIDENSLQKSVSFTLGDSDLEEELDAGGLEMKDSGLGSVTDEEAEAEDRGAESDSAVDSRSRLFYRRRIKKQASRPPWRYWNTEPAPEVTESNHYGPYRIGAYESYNGPISIEILEQMKKKYWHDFDQGEWWDAAEQSNPSVKDSLGYHIPRPPPKPEKQGPGKEISEVLGTEMPDAELKAQQRLDNRRYFALRREQDWQERLMGEDCMARAMQDGHRERAYRQQQHELVRAEAQADVDAGRREAKKAINAELRMRIESNQTREEGREQQRLDALRARREHVEEVRLQRQLAIADTAVRRQAVKEQNGRVRWESVNERLAEEAVKGAVRDQQHRAAKLDRIHHYRRLEAEGQRMRNLQLGVRQHQRDALRSQVLG